MNGEEVGFTPPEEGRREWGEEGGRDEGGREEGRWRGHRGVNTQKVRSPGVYTLSSRETTLHYKKIHHFSHYG